MTPPARDERKVCTVCGEAEPFHIHDRDRRIEDYFVVGRGQTDFVAAKAWKARALKAEAALAAARPFLGDDQHPDWADYVATNLLDALEQVPDTGDWYGAIREWCKQTRTGRLAPAASRWTGRNSPASWLT